MFRIKLDERTFGNLKKNIETISSALNIFKKGRRTPDVIMFTKDYVIYCAYDNTVICRDIGAFTGLATFTKNEEILSIVKARYRKRALECVQHGDDRSAATLQLMSDNLELRPIINETHLDNKKKADEL